MISRQARGLRRVPTHMQEKLISELDMVADMEGVSRSGLIVRLVREGMARIKRRQGHPEQGGKP